MLCIKKNAIGTHKTQDLSETFLGLFNSPVLKSPTQLWCYYERLLLDAHCLSQHGLNVRCYQTLQDVRILDVPSYTVLRCACCCCCVCRRRHVATTHSSTTQPPPCVALALFHLSSIFFLYFPFSLSLSLFLSLFLSPSLSSSSPRLSYTHTKTLVMNGLGLESNLKETLHCDQLPH